MFKKSYILASVVILGGAMMTFAQEAPSTSAPATKPAAKMAAPAKPVSPEVIPGNGLAEHDFFYAGESGDRKMYIVKSGKVIWSYDDPVGKGEISDATLLSNGNVLFAHQFAVELISPEKKVLWKLDAPKGTEIHTAIPIGHDHVLFIQNGAPAMLRIVNITTGSFEKEFPLEVKNPASVHGQFRHARLTVNGTVMVAHMDMGKVSEYDFNGKEIWTVPAMTPWGVEPLKNGNFLITDRNGIHEVNREKKTVWEVTRADLPGYTLANLQLAWRLPNGNTILNNWASLRQPNPDPAYYPVQAIEVTPDKKIVWALRSWTGDDNLGASTTIQLLDSMVVPENVSFGDIK